MTNTNLESQAIARICHDLISPIGAISNGVELLCEMSGCTPELELIAQSARAARDKISFFRVAFDGPSPGVLVSGDTVAQTAMAMFEAARMRVGPVKLPETLPRDKARLLLLLMLCVESALPLGGQLEVSTTAQGISLTGNGRRVSLEPDYWAHLQHGSVVEAPTATRVQFGLARNVLAEFGMDLTVESSDTHISLTLTNT